MLRPNRGMIMSVFTIVMVLALAACSGSSAGPGGATSSAPTTAPAAGGTSSAPTTGGATSAAPSASATYSAPTTGGAGATAPAASGGAGAKIAYLLPETKTTRYETHDRPDFEAKVKQLCPNCQVL